MATATMKRGYSRMVVQGRRSDVASDTEADALGQMIAAIGMGDQESFAKFYDVTSARVLGLAQRITRSRETAEEVACDVFLEIWNKARLFDANNGTVMGWLMTICRNRAIDRVRRTRTQTATFDKLTEISHLEKETAPVTDPQDLLQAVAVNSCVYRSLAKLTVQQQQLLSLAFFRDFSYSQIAEFTATPLGTVKTQIRRALAALRDTISGTEQTLLD